MAVAGLIICIVCVTLVFCTYNSGSVLAAELHGWLVSTARIGTREGRTVTCMTDGVLRVFLLGGICACVLPVFINLYCACHFITTLT